jgi:hypothetical protein
MPMHSSQSAVCLGMIAKALLQSMYRLESHQLTTTTCVHTERAIESKDDLEAKQSSFSKITMGATVFIILVLVIWFPLFLLSSANPTNQPNYITTISVQVGMHTHTHTHNCRCKVVQPHVQVVCD